MTRAEFAGITVTLNSTIKALLDQMVAWTTKIDNNNNNNPNRGEPIMVIRIITSLLLLRIENQNMNMIWNTMNIDITTS